MTGDTDKWLVRCLDEIQTQQTRTLEAVEKLGDEVRTTYAREKDCAERSAQNGLARAEGLKRVWENGIEPLEEQVKHLGNRLNVTDGRVQILENTEIERTGAHKVKRWITGKVAGVVAAILIAGLTGLGGWLFRGCSETEPTTPARIQSSEPQVTEGVPSR